MRAIILALVASLGAIGALIMPTTAAQQAGADAQERAIRLRKLQRDAVTQLQRAARPDRAGRSGLTQRCWMPAAGLEGLSTGPGLEPSMRSELRRAASELTSLASGDTRGAASAIDCSHAPRKGAGSTRRRGRARPHLPGQLQSGRSPRKSGLRRPRLCDGAGAGEHPVTRRRRARCR